MGSRKITDLLLPGAYSLGSDFLAKTVSEEEKRKHPFHDVAHGTGGWVHHIYVK